MAHKRPVIRTAGTTFSGLQARGLAGLIDLVIAANTALTAPSTQATVSATGGGASGGSLAAGTYYLTYTFCNGVGETGIGTSRSAQLTVSAGNIPRVTLPALPTGASHMNVYLTAAGGASGTEVLYYTGQATTTLDMSAATYDNSLVSAPTTNTTALSNIQIRTDWLKRNGINHVVDRFESCLSQFLHGDPLAFADARQNMLRDLAAIETMARAMDDVLILLDANHGTLTTAVNGAGVRNPVRTFP